MTDYIPWIEKYRPTLYSDIILDDINKELFKNIIEKEYIPNLLFFGPPGNGKTTTIINLINLYQKKKNEVNSSLIIHLNASDERGIDIIRNQILQFANSSNLFIKGTKFVILDEIDYMTKNAQQALKYLIQESSNKNIRFCLICNYICKIEEGLQNELIKCKFNQLPKKEITSLIYKISKNEKLNYKQKNIDLLYDYFKSDIRSIINFIQINQNKIYLKIIEKKNWETMIVYFQEKDIDKIKKYITKLNKDYNIDKKNIIKKFISFLIKDRLTMIPLDKFDIIEELFHNNDIPQDVYLHYFIHQFLEFL
jgi:DNA polymerase III delta prime subunit